MKNKIRIKNAVTLDSLVKTILKKGSRRRKTQERIKNCRREQQRSIVLPHCQGQAAIAVTGMPRAQNLRTNQPSDVLF